MISTIIWFVPTIITIFSSSSSAAAEFFDRTGTPNLPRQPKRMVNDLFVNDSSNINNGNPLFDSSQYASSICGCLYNANNGVYYHFNQVFDATNPNYQEIESIVERLKELTDPLGHWDQLVSSDILFHDEQLPNCDNQMYPNQHQPPTSLQENSHNSAIASQSLVPVRPHPQRPPHNYNPGTTYYMYGRGQPYPYYYPSRPYPYYSAFQPYQSNRLSEQAFPQYYYAGRQQFDHFVPFGQNHSLYDYSYYPRAHSTYFDHNYHPNYEHLPAAGFLPPPPPPPQNVYVTDRDWGGTSHATIFQQFSNNPSSYNMPPDPNPFPYWASDQYETPAANKRPKFYSNDHLNNEEPLSIAQPTLINQDAPIGQQASNEFDNSPYIVEIGPDGTYNIQNKLPDGPVVGPNNPTNAANNIQSSLNLPLNVQNEQNPNIGFPNSGLKLPNIVPHAQLYAQHNFQNIRIKDSPMGARDIQHSLSNTRPNEDYFLQNNPSTSDTSSPNNVEDSSLDNQFSPSSSENSEYDFHSVQSGPKRPTNIQIVPNNMQTNPNNSPSIIGQNSPVIPLYFPNSPSNIQIGPDGPYYVGPNGQNIIYNGPDNNQFSIGHSPTTTPNNTPNSPNNIQFGPDGPFNFVNAQMGPNGPNTLQNNQNNAQISTNSPKNLQDNQYNIQMRPNNPNNIQNSKNNIQNSPPGTSNIQMGPKKVGPNSPKKKPNRPKGSKTNQKGPARPNNNKNNIPYGKPKKPNKVKTIQTGPHRPNKNQKVQKNVQFGPHNIENRPKYIQNARNRPKNMQNDYKYTQTAPNSPNNIYYDQSIGPNSPNNNQYGQKNVQVGPNNMPNDHTYTQTAPNSPNNIYNDQSIGPNSPNNNQYGQKNVQVGPNNMQNDHTYTQMAPNSPINMQNDRNYIQTAPNSPNNNQNVPKNAQVGPTSPNNIQSGQINVQVGPTSPKYIPVANNFQNNPISPNLVQNSQNIIENRPDNSPAGLKNVESGQNTVHIGQNRPIHMESGQKIKLYAPDSPYNMENDQNFIQTGQKFVQVSSNSPKNVQNVATNLDNSQNYLLGPNVVQNSQDIVQAGPNGPNDPNNIQNVSNNFETNLNNMQNSQDIVQTGPNGPTNFNNVQNAQNYAQNTEYFYTNPHNFNASGHISHQQSYEQINMHGISSNQNLEQESIGASQNRTHCPGLSDFYTVITIIHHFATKMTATRRSAGGAESFAESLAVFMHKSIIDLANYLQRPESPKHIKCFFRHTIDFVAPIQTYADLAAAIVPILYDLDRQLIEFYASHYKDRMMANYLRTYVLGVRQIFLESFS